MKSISIIENKDLQNCTAQISSKTWKAIKNALGNSVFFPESNTIIVAKNPFLPDYILQIIDKDIPDDALFVSSDVKISFYNNQSIIQI
jgi:hypothetical protein